MIPEPTRDPAPDRPGRRTEDVRADWLALLKLLAADMARRPPAPTGAELPSEKPSGIDGTPSNAKPC